MRALRCQCCGLNGSRMEGSCAECGKGICGACMHQCEGDDESLQFRCCPCAGARGSSDSADSTEPNASGDDNRAERDDAERELRKRARTEGPAGGDSAPA